MLRQITLPNDLEVWVPGRVEAAIVYREVVTEATYQSHGIVLPPEAVVFDVGANVGLFAVHLARMVPGAQVHAFEPVPELFAALQRNLARHAPDARATNAGLADLDGEATFEVDRFMTIAATMHPGVFAARAGTPAAALAAAAIADATKVQSGPVLRLLQRGFATPLGRALLLPVVGVAAVILALRRRLFLRRPRCRLITFSSALASSGAAHVDLLKIDVEGAEEQVIAGIGEADWPRIRQLVVEVHDIDNRLERLTALLERRGYRTARAQEDWALHRLLGIWILYAQRDTTPS